jgi:uncharacterized protein
MRCLVCDINLRAGEREGVEVEYCPHCHGVWLDQGELERVIERSNPMDWDWHRNDEAKGLRTRCEVYW